LVDALNRRDLDGFMETATEDFEWSPAMAQAVDGGGYRGREGIERHFVDLHTALQGFRAVLDEYRDLGDCVLGVGRIKRRGRTGGVDVQSPMTAILDFRGGKMVSGRTYLDHGEALRAAGLSE